MCLKSAEIRNQMPQSSDSDGQQASLRNVILLGNLGAKTIFLDAGFLILEILQSILKGSAKNFGEIWQNCMKT